MPEQHQRPPHASQEDGDDLADLAGRAVEDVVDDLTARAHDLKRTMTRAVAVAGAAGALRVARPVLRALDVFLGGEGASDDKPEVDPGAARPRAARPSGRTPRERSRGGRR